MKSRHMARHTDRSGLEYYPHERGSGANMHPTVSGKDRGPIVTRDDWKRKPLPGKTTTIALGHAYSGEELALIRRGLVPEQITDQWFIFYEDDALYFHRSWTGHCIYVVYFHHSGDEMRAAYAAVNRDPGQYGETDDQRDRVLVLELIDVLLLQRPLPQRA